MQRNSHILKSTKMRSGIAMITAIAFLVIISGIMAVMMNMSSLANKRTEHLYFTEQAQLLAKSATEFALLAISGHDRAGGSCLQTISSTYAGYLDVNTTIRYIGLAGLGGTCATNSFVNAVNTTQSVGTVLIDVYVTSDDAVLNLGNPISYHRRTIQKP